MSLKDGQVRGYEPWCAGSQPKRPAGTDGLLQVARQRQHGSHRLANFAAASQPIAAQTDFTGYLGLNVAPRHFRNPSFASNCWTMLKTAGLPPSRLCGKITEAPDRRP